MMLCAVRDAGVYGCLSTDDLGEAVRAITTKDSHPHLHPMEGWDYREYFVTRSIEALIADVGMQHDALWPAVRSVIHTHATWGTPIVIEGWSLWPERVIALGLPSVHSLWLVAEEETLRERMVEDVEFYRGASDEQGMMRNFLARSCWYNANLREAVERFAFPSIALPVRAPVEASVKICLDQLKG